MLEFFAFLLHIMHTCTCVDENNFNLSVSLLHLSLSSLGRYRRVSGTEFRVSTGEGERAEAVS